MKIRICKGYKCFFVERLNDRNEWIYWLPKEYESAKYKSFIEALHAAKEEQEAEWIDQSLTLGYENYGIEIDI